MTRTAVLTIRPHTQPGRSLLSSAALGRSRAVDLLVTRAPTLQPAAFGGWQTVPRRGERAAIEWQGADPEAIQAGVMLDGFAQQRSIEQDIARLEGMACGLDGFPPPIVTVTGPLPATDVAEWVIGQLEPGPALWRDDLAARVRQEYTLTLIAANLGTVLVERPTDRARRRASGASKSRGAPETYVVKSGDTLLSIAARRLGKASRWREIADLNNVRDPRRLKVGARLKLPTK